jgi:hypothetical protein
MDLWFVGRSDEEALVVPVVLQMKEVRENGQKSTGICGQLDRAGRVEVDWHATLR